MVIRVGHREGTYVVVGRATLRTDKVGSRNRLLHPWPLIAFRSWFRVRGWCRSRPYSVTVAVVLGGFRVFQDVSGSPANDHGIHLMMGDCAGAIVAKGWRPSRWRRRECDER